MGILNIPETTSMGRDCLDGDEREYADGVYLMDGRKVRDSSEIEGLPSGHLRQSGLLFRIHL